MRLSLLTVALMSAATLVGCSARPESVQVVDQSVLPAAAKALLVNGATLTKVEKQTYAKGTTMYKMYYTFEGESKAIVYNSKQTTTPTGVFEEPMR